MLTACTGVRALATFRRASGCSCGGTNSEDRVFRFQAHQTVETRAKHPLKFDIVGSPGAISRAMKEPLQSGTKQAPWLLTPTFRDLLLFGAFCERLYYPFTAASWGYRL